MLRCHFFGFQVLPFQIGNNRAIRLLFTQAYQQCFRFKAILALPLDLEQV